VDVFLLWHVRHAPFLEGSPTEHRDGNDELVWDGEDGDSVKLLGVYSTEQSVQERIVRARKLPDFVTSRTASTSPATPSIETGGPKASLRYRRAG
jgi:hypothetical protein